MYMRSNDFAIKTSGHIKKFITGKGTTKKNNSKIFRTHIQTIHVMDFCLKESNDSIDDNSIESAGCGEELCT